MKTVAVNYFSKLLNSSIDQDSVISLSSGQRSRAHAWLKAKNYNFDEEVLRLRSAFSVNQLLRSVRDASLTSTSLFAEKDGYSINFEKADLDPSDFIGIDIQSITELFPEGLSSDPKSDPELLGIFTFKELSYAQARHNPIQTLTGLFAAKEAILKCVEKEIKLSSIEILPDPKGRPMVNGFRISISHSQDNAVAIAIPIPLRTKYDETRGGEFSSSSLENREERSKVGIGKLSYLVLPITVLVLVLIEIVRFLS